MVYDRLVLADHIYLYNVYPAAERIRIIPLIAFSRENKILLFTLGDSRGGATVFGVLRQSASCFDFREHGPVAVKGYYVYLSVRGAVVPLKYNVTERQQVLARRALAFLTESSVSVNSFHLLI